MARVVTLLQLRTDIAAQCDFSMSVSGRYQPVLLNRLINQSIQRFRERISDAGATHYLVSTSGSLAAGTTTPYAFQVLDLSAVNPPIVRLYGVDISVAGVNRSLAHRSFIERNDYTTSPTMTNQPAAWAAFQDGKVAIMPGPDTAYPYTVWYLPLLPDLVNDGDTFDGVAGWEIWVLWDCVCQLIARDQYQAAYQQAVMERDNAWADVNRSATRVTSAGGATVGRDTMGNSAYMLRAARRVNGQAGGSTLPPLGSVTDAMLAQRTGPVVIGRVTASLGVTSDLGLASVPIGSGTDLGNHWEWDGSLWVQRRNWFTPSLDLTGVTDMTATINAAMNAIAATRDGACVYLPDGIIKCLTGLVVPPGLTLTGNEHGASVGPFVFNNGMVNAGTRLDFYSTSAVGITLGQQSRLLNFECYYPNQQTNATPDSYNYLIDVPGNAHWATIENIACINPDKFLRIGGNTGLAANGIKVDTILGYPLDRGITIYRCADVARINNVQFGPALNYHSGATLKAYVQANAIAMLIDGPEEFMIQSFFAYGYNTGLNFHDEDGDGFRGVYGSGDCIGLDICNRGILVDEPNGLTLRGFRVSNIGIAMNANTMNGVLFTDKHVPASDDQRPAIYMTNATFWNSMSRAAYLVNGSHGLFSLVNGSVQGHTNEAMRVETGTGSFDHVFAAATRTGGGGTILDTNALT